MGGTIEVVPVTIAFLMISYVVPVGRAQAKDHQGQPWSAKGRVLLFSHLADIIRFSWRSIIGVRDSSSRDVMSSVCTGHPSENNIFALPTPQP